MSDTWFFIVPITRQPHSPGRESNKSAEFPLKNTFGCDTIILRHKFNISNGKRAFLLLVKMQALFSYACRVGMNLCRSNGSYAFFGAWLLPRTFLL